MRTESRPQVDLHGLSLPGSCLHHPSSPWLHGPVIWPSTGSVHSPSPNPLWALPFPGASFLGRHVAGSSLVLSSGSGCTSRHPGSPVLDQLPGILSRTLRIIGWCLLLSLFIYFCSPKLNSLRMGLRFLMFICTFLEQPLMCKQSHLLLSK